MSHSNSWQRPLSIAALAGTALFVLGWLAGAALQNAGYDWTRHGISDLGALTARAPWVMLGGQAPGGVTTIAFAIGALQPALALPGRGLVFGAWMVAASLMGLDNVSDAFFRLDCMAADPGCTMAVATGSPAGTVHLGVALVTALVTVAAPFVLLPRLRRVPGWSDLAAPTFAAGIALFLGLAGYVMLEGRSSQGIVQRVMALVAAAWIGALALRVRRLAPA